MKLIKGITTEDTIGGTAIQINPADTIIGADSAGIDIRASC